MLADPHCPWWPPVDDAKIVARSQAAVEASLRVLALPYWPRDRIPPTVEFLFDAASIWYRSEDKVLSAALNRVTSRTCDPSR